LLEVSVVAAAIATIQVIINHLDDCMFLKENVCCFLLPLRNTYQLHSHSLSQVIYLNFSLWISNLIATQSNSSHKFQLSLVCCLLKIKDGIAVTAAAAAASFGLLLSRRKSYLRSSQKVYNYQIMCCLLNDTLCFYL